MDQPDVEVQCTSMMDLAAIDVGAFREKAKEYGSADLEVMGAAMAELLGLHHDEGVEAALAFYILGKVSRAFGAIKMGKIPSDDTWHDVTVYSLMIRERRLRDNYLDDSEVEGQATVARMPGFTYNPGVDS